MPELRKDPVVNRWVIVATERARRPAAFIDPAPTGTDPKTCPFCKDNSAGIYAYEGVRVLKSGTPLFDGQAFQIERKGLYEVCHSHGSHEVVIETPEHIANMADLSVAQIKHVFKTYAVRMENHTQDPSIEYILAYKNYGIAAGSRSIGHARSQIMAIPVLPMRINDKIIGAQQYYDAHERCLFCDMIRQELGAKERVILENEHFVVIAPFAGRFPFETLIIPKAHHSNFAEGLKGREEALAQAIKDILLKFKLGLNDPAYNYMIQTAPLKSNASYKDSYHWHIELIPRLTRVAGFERGTGFYISPIPPEMSAQFLKEVQV